MTWWNLFHRKIEDYYDLLFNYSLEITPYLIIKKFLVPRLKCINKNIFFIQDWKLTSYITWLIEVSAIMAKAIQISNARWKITIFLGHYCVGDSMMQNWWNRTMKWAFLTLGSNELPKSPELVIGPFWMPGPHAGPLKDLACQTMPMMTEGPWSAGPTSCTLHIVHFTNFHNSWSSHANGIHHFSICFFCFISFTSLIR